MEFWNVPSDSVPSEDFTFVESFRMAHGGMQDEEELFYSQYETRGYEDAFDEDEDEFDENVDEDDLEIDDSVDADLLIEDGIDEDDMEEGDLEDEDLDDI